MNFSYNIATFIFSLLPVFHSGLSRFKFLLMHTKYVFRNRSYRCYDDRLALTVTSSTGWCSDVTHRSYTGDLSPITLQFLGFYHWTLSISFFVANIKIIHWKYIAYQTMRQFKPQSAVCTWYRVCVSSPICNVKSTFYTDRFCLLHLIDKWFFFFFFFGFLWSCVPFFHSSQFVLILESLGF